jgi:hypothetical protein
MKNIPSIYELRKQGYKVRVTHVRKFFRFDPRTGKKKEFFARFETKKPKKEIQPELFPKEKTEEVKDPTEEFFLSGKGGETIIEIASKSGKELAKAIAVCSEEDSYVKKIGIKKATALALRQINENKDIYGSLRKMFSSK